MSPIESLARVSKNPNRGQRDAGRFPHQKDAGKGTFVALSPIHLFIYFFLLLLVTYKIFNRGQKVSPIVPD